MASHPSTHHTLFSITHLLAGIARRITDFYGRLAFVILRTQYPRDDAHGFEINCFLDDASASLRRLRAGLDFVAAIDPVRFRRIQLDLPRFMLVPVGGLGYNPHLRACVLSAPYIDRVPEDVLALTIVHEATHARLHRAGIAYRAQLIERVERCCVRSEIAFARRVPGGESLARYAEEKLQHDWWTPEKRAQRLERELNELEMPGWYKRLIKFGACPRDTAAS